MRTLATLAALWSPAWVSAAVTINDATDETLDCFEIVTPSATYYYDKAGAGFTSLVDGDGEDWIGFSPEGTAGVPNGQSGWYRGIPNMGLDVFGHPGYTGATTTTPDTLGVAHDFVTVESTKSGWQVRWVFYDDHARMDVLSVAESYWFLYEGTPGGAVGGDDDCIRPDGTTTSLSSSWEGDVVNDSGWAPGSEWVLFADGTQDRSLFLMHEDDDITDRYYLMDPMTVFGFGRHAANLDRLMSDTPATLMIGLLETRERDVAGPILHALWTHESAPDGGTPDGAQHDGGGPGDPAGSGDPAGPGDPIPVGDPAGPGDAIAVGDPIPAGDPAGPGDPTGPGDPGTPGDASAPGDGPGPSDAIDEVVVVGSCACSSSAQPLGLALLLALRRRRRMG